MLPHGFIQHLSNGDVPGNPAVKFRDVPLPQPAPVLKYLAESRGGWRPRLCNLALDYHDVSLWAECKHVKSSEAFSLNSLNASLLYRRPVRPGRMRQREAPGSEDTRLAENGGARNDIVTS